MLLPDPMPNWLNYILQTETGTGITKCDPRVFVTSVNVQITPKESCDNWVVMLRQIVMATFD